MAQVVISPIKIIIQEMTIIQLSVYSFCLGLVYLKVIKGSTIQVLGADL